MYQLECKEFEAFGTKLVIVGAPDDPYFGTVEQRGAEHRVLAEILRGHVSSDATIIDVGSNIGVTVVLTARLVPNAKIIAIEPSPKALACLQQTIAKNELSGVIPLQKCVGASNQPTARFREARSLASSHRVSEGGLLVPSISVDELIVDMNLSRVDLVKIDVEGFEADVLAGMEQTIATFDPIILMEFNSFTLTAYGNISPRSLLDRIGEQFGSIYWMDRNGRMEVARKPDERIALLHRNMIEHGCVDDLVFRRRPIMFRELDQAY